MSAYTNESATSPPPRSSGRSATASAQGPTQWGRGFEAKDDREPTLFSDESFPPLSKESQGGDKINRLHKKKPFEKPKLQKTREAAQLESEDDLMEMFPREEGPQVGGDGHDPKVNPEPGRTSHNENPKRGSPSGATDVQGRGRGSRDPKTRLELEQASKSKNPKPSSKQHNSRGKVRGGQEQRGGPLIGPHSGTLISLPGQDSDDLVNVPERQISRSGSLGRLNGKQDEKPGNDSPHREESQHYGSHKQHRRPGVTQGKRPDTKLDKRSRKSPNRSASNAGGVRLDDNSPEINERAESNPRNKPKSSQMPPDRRPSKSQQHLELLEKKNQDLESENQKFVSIISEKDDQIAQLKEMISRLHQRDGEPPKADSYFATGFSDIACSIEQWVLEHFQCGPNDPGASTISPELQVMFSMATSQLEKHLNSERMRVMSAVFAQLLWNEISSLSQDFTKCDMPGAPDTTRALRLIASKIQGNFYQHHRWRATTVSLVAKGDDFEAGLAEYVNRAAEKLGELLSVLSPLESDNILRKNGLRAIVDKGAKLAIEIHKQPDWIYLNQVLPGTPFCSEYMEDINYQYSENELEIGKASVQIQVFPSVLRFPCDWDGNPSTLPVVVMKAKTISELPLSGEALLK